MKVLQVHCTYQYQGGEDSVVANEKKLLESSGVIVEQLIFSNHKNNVQKVLQAVFNTRAYHLTRKKIKAYRPDIVHIHNLHFAASPAVIYAVHKSGIPFVQTLHNYRLLCPSATLFYQGKLFLHSLRQNFPWSAIYAGVYRNSKLLTGWMALSVKIHQWMGTWEKAGKYIVLTRHAQNIFLASSIRFKKGQITVKPNFTTAVHVAASGSACDYIFIGRLSEEKGIPVLLKAFASLPHKIKIAGDGPLLEEVLTYAAAYSNIEYAGIISRENVFSFLRTGAALIFPSAWYEGMPMVIVEAFACGLPVIASRLGAMENMIVPGYNGFHFEPGQPEDLQRVVIQYNNLSREDKKAYGENAYQTYRDLYTPEKNVDQLLHIYDDVIHAAAVIGSKNSSYTLG